ncbi:retrovirus-related pol polyprotein from transposon TNT 1-94 [Tanacetum coccineum]
MLSHWKKVQSDDDYNVFANERQHSEQPESINDTYVVEKVDSGVISYSSNMCDNDDKDDQNAEEYEDKRVVLANLIANLKLDTDENKKIQRQLKKANASLAHELKECKSALTELNDVRDRCRSALYQKEVELEKYKTYKNCQLEKEEIERKYKESLSLLAQQKHQSNESLTTQAYETFQFKEKNVELAHQGSLEHIRYDLIQKKKEQLQKDFKISQDKDIDKIIALENQVPYDKDDLANIFPPNCDETLILEQDSRSKLDKDLTSKPSVLGKPTPFSDSLERKDFSKTKSVNKTNVSAGTSKPVTSQILPQTARQAVRNTNVIKLRMYQTDTRTTQTRASQLPQTSRNTNPRVSTSTGLIHKTSVSRTQLKSTQMKEKVMQNHSQVKLKKMEVEDHHRNFIISNKKSLSKKPQEVPNRPRKPIRKANQSVATPPKKIVTLDSTIQKSKSYYKMLYEKTRNLVQENITIKRVYYVEGLNHNLFSVGQFCDADLEVAFRKSTCFVRELQGNELLMGNRGSDLYTISLQETSSPTPICFMAKASPTQSWLWHRRLSHLNFDTINLLSKKDIVNGLPKLKYVKDQLCSSCELGTEFLNKTLNAFFKQEGIEQQTSTPRTPEQNGVVERQNRTLVEAARTMLSASKLL